MTFIAIFASGSGSNAENIAKYFSGRDDIRVSLIISNRKEAPVHERSKKLGIPSYTFSKSEIEEGSQVLKTLRNYNVNFIILAGFLLKISNPLLEAFPNRIINIHPALLPNHGGKGMYGDRVHQAVIKSGELQTGITIHYINENYDEGDIIFQKTCKVSPEDTLEDIANRVHSLEYEYYPKIIESILKK